MKPFGILVFAFLISGCASVGHVQFYDQVAPAVPGNG
jgi:hypothetical protein